MELPNLEEFRSLLMDAAREAFTSIQSQHPDETFYAFSLYHEPLWSFVFPTSNTEEGLLRRAEYYKFNRPPYGEKSIEELTKKLRWNPADWEYHALKEDFQIVNNWLLEIDVYDLFDDYEEEEEWLVHFEPFNDQMYEICRSTMQTLDRESIFTQTQGRENIVLNIMMGDQDNSWIEHARVLNPPSVFARWIAEVEAGKPY